MQIDPIEKFEPPAGTEILAGGTCLRLDSSIYPVNLVMRTAYWFTDDAYIYLNWENQEKTKLVVSFYRKEDSANLRTLACDFLNSLLDQAVRKQVESETHEIREIIIKKAFSEALSTKERTVAQQYGD